jgi:octaprenyl-diphosphate synthase
VNLSRLDPQSTIGHVELRQAYELINTHLYDLEERIHQQVAAFDPTIAPYVAYACESSGKRLRPALALLVAGATGKITSTHLELAVVIELIHAATLVHDDIIDGAEKRRAQPTASAKWGNTISVLLGDCLFAHALKISTSFPGNDISRRIAHAAAEICSGEIMQTQRRFDLKLSVTDYFRIIEMKTAELFMTATELAALINQEPPEVISSMKIFGRKLGIAYQIYDDCLDVAGDEVSAGKTLGSDLRKGKLTLPILYLLQRADDLRSLNDAILRAEPEDIELLLMSMREHGALNHAIADGHRALQEGESCLEILPESCYRDGLQSVCRTVEALLTQFSD